ncbi:YhbD family protein [Brevibacillus choshinensis]|uniref:YhbD family protein n=1 Tax=Brevibacillus choshinensis TaxID=54911 RepID=A0ABX7FQ72_BRECH|nr:YhbD family protein [Brevibacillus choshinensis]QRG67447.1 YhbD family protein [Brevibacillus choshinensis]
MEDDFISKKELLELTGISYGQLYRWKRKNLIPEDWFIRRSTFTGQETFFPKEQILARIDKIIHMKDDLSLDELADMFSPNLAESMIMLEDLIKQNIVSKATLDLFAQHFGITADAYPFQNVLYAYIVERLLVMGEMGLEEGRGLLQVLDSHYPAFQGKPCELIFVRKMGVSAFALAPRASELYFDNSVKVVSRLNVASCLEELKAKLLK